MHDCGVCDIDAVSHLLPDVSCKSGQDGFQGSGVVSAMVSDAAFHTHCFGGGEAEMPGRFDKSMTLDSDWASDFCGTEDFLKSNGLWAGSTIYNNTSDSALRSICYKYGADVTFTEMTRFDSLARKNASTWEKIKFCDDTPAYVQIVGQDEQKLKHHPKTCTAIMAGDE